ncbi:DUF2948 family protein [Methylocella sp.]|uniref:DUF2948 family protein n=1 Tax=Methylocella sp. TaxID=1978226 RepID=UPI0035AF9C5C
MTQTQTASGLKLLARDAEDLDVVSANLQDALVLVGDMAYLPRSKQFAFLACRFDWEKAAAGALERCRAGLAFEAVEQVFLSGFSRADKGRILNLLRVGFTEAADGGGLVELVFSGGCGLRLKVSRLEARLADRGERWSARARPGHACLDAEG